MRQIAVFAAALLSMGPLAAQNHGLTAAADALGGPRWQARFEQDGVSALPLRTTGLMAMKTQSTQSLRLMGDYQSGWLRLGDTGGLRLSGGVLLSVRQNLGLGASTDSSGLAFAGVGYAGVGYSYGAGRGPVGPEWGFSADLGLTGLSFGNPQLGRQSLGSDANWPALRLQPTLRLGMNLSF
ncbi:MAG: hypothetical protein KBC73_24190 [Burkholderiaceae bacterium]|nr:hypothetical protein [Burkholderiaceae bacterium]